eukprot:gene33187-22215_t
MLGGAPDGCNGDLNTLNPEAPVGTLLKSFCPVLGVCADDADGHLAAAGVDCET